MSELLAGICYGAGASTVLIAGLLMQSWWWVGALLLLVGRIVAGVGEHG